MMTESEHKYSHQITNTKGRGLHLLWITLIVFMALFFQNEIAAQEKLKAGTWKGTFLTHDGKLYKIKYIVSYSDKAKVKIKMIYIDLEPASEFTFDLSDIKIKNKRLQFKIPKEYETKECTLEQDNGSFSGKCTSTACNTGETSEITMVPPASE